MLGKKYIYKTYIYFYILYTIIMWISSKNIDWDVKLLLVITPSTSIQYFSLHCLEISLETSLKTQKFKHIIFIPHPQHASRFICNVIQEGKTHQLNDTFTQMWSVMWHKPW